MASKKAGQGQHGRRPRHIRPSSRWASMGASPRKPRKIRHKTDVPNNAHSHDNTISRLLFSIHDDNEQSLPQPSPSGGDKKQSEEKKTEPAEDEKYDTEHATVIAQLRRNVNMAMQDNTYTVTIRDGQRMVELRVEAHLTVKQLKQMYLDRAGGSSNFELFYTHKRLSKDDATLKEYDITLDGSTIFMERRVCGGGVLAELHREWTVMYCACPVCHRKGMANLVKGYWYHPGSQQAEFRKEKPGTYAIESKQSKMRCSGCKNEVEAEEWQFKCPNHDYKKYNE